MPSSVDGARRRIRWRRWNNAIHRDVGYAAVALTLIYAISGIAVNHIQDWNPNYRFVREEVRFEPVSVSTREEMVGALVERLGLEEAPRESFRSRPDQVELFYDGWSVKADATAGVAVVERPKERPLLFDVNFLHLNRPGGLWTWVADLYALLLAILAITGLFVLKGKTGLGGRGKWWVLAGLLVPVAFLLVLRWL